MSVTTQAFKYALNNIESLMKQAVIEIKNILDNAPCAEYDYDNTAYNKYDYFVISLELTLTGFKPRFKIEKDDLNILAYKPNITAIFVDKGYKILSWENLTHKDIIDFNNILAIKLEHAEKYDALADSLTKHN